MSAKLLTLRLFFLHFLIIRSLVEPARQILRTDHVDKGLRVRLPHRIHNFAHLVSSHHGIQHVTFLFGITALTLDQGGIAS